MFFVKAIVNFSDLVISFLAVQTFILNSIPDDLANITSTILNRAFFVGKRYQTLDFCCLNLWIFVCFDLSKNQILILITLMGRQFKILSRNFYIATWALNLNTLAVKLYMSFVVLNGFKLKPALVAVSPFFHSFHNVLSFQNSWTTLHQPLVHSGADHHKDPHCVRLSMDEYARISAHLLMQGFLGCQQEQVV